MTKEEYLLVNETEKFEESDELFVEDSDSEDKTGLKEKIDSNYENNSKDEKGSENLEESKESKESKDESDKNENTKINDPVAYAGIEKSVPRLLRLFEKCHNSKETQLVMGVFGGHDCEIPKEVVEKEFETQKNLYQALINHHMNWSNPTDNELLGAIFSYGTSEFDKDSFTLTLDCYMGPNKDVANRVKSTVEKLFCKKYYDSDKKLLFHLSSVNTGEFGIFTLRGSKYCRLVVDLHSLDIPFYIYNSIKDEGAEKSGNVILIVMYPKSFPLPEEITVKESTVSGKILSYTFKINKVI